MKQFVEAFGGLIGVVLIGLAVLVVMVVADRLMNKAKGEHRGEQDGDLPR